MALTRKTKRIILAAIAGAGGVLIAAGIIEPALLDAVTQAAQDLLEAMSSGSVSETTE